MNSDTWENLPAGAVPVFGAGSKLLRATCALFEACSEVLLAPLSASLDGSAALRMICSSFPRLEPAGNQKHPN